MIVSAHKTFGGVSMEKIKVWLSNSYWSVLNCFTFRLDNYDDNIDRCAFFEEINSGWYQMYIYPYDDLYLPTISQERKLRIDQHPETIYVSKEAYDELVRRINEPPDPKVVERFREIMNRKAPWDN
jgi:hypothetical protein